MKIFEEYLKKGESKDFFVCEVSLKYTEKTKVYSKDNFNAMGEGLENILEEFAVCMKKMIITD